jgi:hypothetical protein
MAATLELKYFNSFWLKKLDSIVDVINTVSTLSANVTNSATIVLTTANPEINVGQLVSWIGITENVLPSVIYVNGTTITLNKPVSILQYSAPSVLNVLTFGPIADFTYIPNAYFEQSSDWFVEESRIQGGYNNTDVDLGVKAYLIEPDSKQQHLISTLIYSGVLNSRTGVNNTNQFSVGEDITRGVDPSVGSIQKLYAEDTNLIIFQELKVSRALIDKDAIYSAEGQPMTTSGAQVIGQVQQYAGNYGISTNPESFAIYGYRKYFTDRNQNVVLRLSQDGITEISSIGMIDYFRDNLSNVGNAGKIIGGWDMHNKQYVVSMQPYNSENYATLSFDEDVLGWTSRFSYKPNLSGSLRNNYYTFKNGNIWKHYADPVIDLVNYCNFYTTQYNSSVSLVFNPEVSAVKNFNTINYEGTTGWALESIYSNTDIGIPISKTIDSFNLGDLENQLFTNNFKRKENKYFGTIINNTLPTYGEIIYGQSMNGIKGFYTTITMIFENPLPPLSPQYAELYSVSSNFVKSSY